MEMHPSPRSSYIEHHRAHNQHRSERTSLTNDSYRHGIQLAANKVQNDTKTTQFGVGHSTKLTSFINWLDETAKTAKPLCVGSIPPRASNISTT
jgi:hypothetical protein